LRTNDAVAVLDVEVTPELAAEGRARDLVRLVQQARKDAGLEVTDRISLRYESTPRMSVLGEALGAHRDWIVRPGARHRDHHGAHRRRSHRRGEVDGETVAVEVEVSG
jgi:hypothetical protein